MPTAVKKLKIFTHTTMSDYHNQTEYGNIPPSPIPPPPPTGKYIAVVTCAVLLAFGAIYQLLKHGH